MSEMPATSTATISKPERLPVNPRRHKVPIEKRKRVAKACDACNVRRAKCSGGQPCDRCQRASRECQYPISEETITISRREYNELLRKCQNSKGHLSLAVESSPSGEDQSSISGSEHSPSSNVSTFPADLEGPREGRILQDPDGVIRYLGESAGATFLDHLREHLVTCFPLAFDGTWPSSDSSTGFIAALGRYQTHDSRALPTTTIDSFTLPTKDEALTMLSEVRYWAQDGAATVESGGIHYWVNIDELISSYYAYLSASRAKDVSSNLALINAAFALACQFNPSCGPKWDSSSGQTFFARARALIGNPFEVSTIADGHALSLLGFYLLNWNRRDAAYIYISVAMHILVVHGVHRAWMIDEDGKRLFWTIYNLDRWLSCLMGRPPMIADEAIKLDLPRHSRGLPSPRGLCAQIQLSKISNFIVSNIFEVSKQPEEPLGTVRCIQKALQLLMSWRNGLPNILQYVEKNFSQDRAVYELRMAHNQLLILAVRPLLLEAVKTAIASAGFRGWAQRLDMPHRLEIEQSAKASRQNVHLCRQVLRLRQPATLSITNIHNSFNAALSLELYQILLTEDLTQDREDIAFTTALLSADKGSNKEFARDCAKVLADFVSTIDRLRRTQLHIPSHSRSELENATSGATDQDTPLLHLQSDVATEWHVLLSSSPPETRPELRSHHVPRPLPRDRDSLYPELLSWLQDDCLQPSP